MIKQATDIYFKTFVRTWDRIRIERTVLITMTLVQNILTFFKERTCHYWPAMSPQIWTRYSVQDNKIKQQAYHVRSMVCNNCHKYLREEVTDLVCDSSHIITNGITHNWRLNKLAFEICSKFKSINKTYHTLKRSCKKK